MGKYCGIELKSALEIRKRKEEKLRLIREGKVETLSLPLMPTRGRLRVIRKVKAKPKRLPAQLQQITNEWALPAQHFMVYTFPLLLSSVV